MKLYEYADSFSQLFDEFDAIADFEPAQNDAGQYIDDDGNIIPDLAAYKADMQQAWFDTLDGIEEGFEVKAENIACFIKQLDGELEMLKKQKAAFERRRKAKETQLEGMRNYLLTCMQKIGRTKIETPLAKISIRNNAESVQIDNESDFITRCQMCGADDYLRYKTPEIDKTAVKADLQKGYKIEGASLVRKQSIIIK